MYLVILYGAPILGTESFSCIQAVQNRAARYFLNVGKYSPVAAFYSMEGYGSLFKSKEAIPKVSCSG